MKGKTSVYQGDLRYEQAILIGYFAFLIGMIATLATLYYSGGLK